jgi:hypothetical protein
LLTQVIRAFWQISSSKTACFIQKTPFKSEKTRFLGSENGVEGYFGAIF